MKRHVGSIAVVDCLRTGVKESAQRLGEIFATRLKTTEGRRQRQRNGFRVGQLFWRNSAHLLPHQHFSGVV